VVELVSQYGANQVVNQSAEMADKLVGLYRHVARAGDRIRPLAGERLPI
jgi:hypothetical protein